MTKNLGAALAATRIALGLVFLWAFIDKLFGLGYATCRDKATGAVTVMCEKAWLNGGSPTKGFLGNVSGTFASLFKPLAGLGIVDWLFMIGLLCIGLALIFGVGLHIAAWTGGLLLVLMWLAELPLANHPFLDEHLIYALLLWVFCAASAGEYYGLGKWWKEQSIVKAHPWLE